MRRSMLIILALVLFILPASADDVYSYSGATAQYATVSAGFDLSIDSSTWLKTSANGSDNSFVYYGFSTSDYSDDNTGKLVLDKQNGNKPTLFFKEEIASIKGNTYKGVASFKIYFYIISNSKYKATLTWSDLSRSSGNGTKTLTVAINESSSKSMNLKNGTRNYLFDPADGIYQKIEMSFEAVTASYSIPKQKTSYTGWLQLTLETQS